MGTRRLLGLAMVALLAAGVSYLPAGQGYVGRTTTTASGGAIDTSINPTFSEPLSPGESLVTARNNLVNTINTMDPRFAAASFTDPNDPTLVAYTVTLANGGEIEHLNQCENDPNVDNAGVVFPGGNDAAVLNKVAQINANAGGNYVLTVSTLHTGTFSKTYNTTLAPNNTATGLNASITADLTAAGFSVLLTPDNLNFIIRKPCDLITGLQVSSSDTGVAIFCVDVTTDGRLNQGIPTVSQWGMLALIILMTGAAFWTLRRRQAAGV